MSVDYKKIEFALHESLVQIDNAYRLLGYDASQMDKIQECMDLVKTKRYSIAVMGEFKRGKSSLINALLGSKILPADATPTTATINRITFATTPKAVVTYKDGAEEEIGIDDLSGYVTKLTPDGEHRAMKIREATIYFPTQICQNYVDIIDTPGLNDEERMTKITIDMLENVDAVIVPIHARAPFSATEKGFVCQMLESDGIHDIVFVITFMDQLDEDDYEYDSFIDYVRTRIQNEVFEELERRCAEEHVLGRAHTILDDLNLFAVSSTLALKSFITNSRADLKKSGFDEFSASLLHIVTAKQIENAVQKSVEQIHFMISGMAEQNKERVERLNSEITKAEDSCKIVSDYGGKAKKLLNELFAASYDGIEDCIVSLNAFKNSAVSLFVKSLSGIKVNSHDVIKEVLTGAVLSCEAAITNDGMVPVAQKVLQQLDLGSIEEYRRSELLPALSVFNITQDEDVAAAMRGSAEKSLSELAFTWTYPAIADVTDLSNYNVIETVIDAVDRSVSDCVSRFSAAVTDIRKNWFLQADEDAKRLTTLVNGVYREKIESLDRELKAQLHNYSVIEADSQVIVDRCDQLRTEVLSSR